MTAILIRTFNRPGFLEMLADIEAGMISMVMVEDMSRFGRNYFAVGLYTEICFPEVRVRFVVANDGVDNYNQMGNDFAPFRNIMNEWYAKDTSKKIRAVLRNKGMSGKRESARTSGRSSREGVLVSPVLSASLFHCPILLTSPEK